MDTRICNHCNIPKTRVSKGHNGNQIIYVDDEGKRWSGKTCGACFSKICALKMKLRRVPSQPSLKQCKGCKQEFVQKHREQKWCSNKCYKVYYKNPNRRKNEQHYRQKNAPKFSCKICNKEFSYIGRKVYCSKECAYQGVLHNVREYSKRIRTPKPKLQIPKKHCKDCNKVLPKKNRTLRCQYCISKNKKPIPIKINKHCPTCNSIFIRHGQHNKKFCSEKCQKKYSPNKQKKRLADRIRQKEKQKRIPPWQSNEELYKFYKECPPGHFVDHRIPLNHKDVCGLHCVDNFQYLPLLENSFKNNKFDYTYDNESWRKEFKKKYGF